MAMYETSQKDGRSKSFTFSSYNEKTDVNLRSHRVFIDHLEVAGRIGSTTGAVSVPVVGRQNLPNVMGAACIGLALGMSEAAIWESLPHLQTIWGRGQLIHHPAGAQIVFDGYNSNPDSAAALLRTMMEIEVSGRKIAILGEMLELGDFSESAHQELGEIAGGTIFNAVWFIGPSAGEFEKGLKRARFTGEFFHSPNVDPSMASYFNQRVQQGDVVVIKGSRGVHLEKILEIWKISSPKP
jgi:UDP-N-acetylmuramoyl-tripeptide--D-alanyl-D-alanine ligase